MKSDLVSIILSFRNEQDNLPELIRRLTVMADARPEGYEFIFVNDCSNDGSRNLLVEARAKDSRVKFVTTARRVGPIVINRRTRVGRQLVISNYSRYSAHHPLMENAQGVGRVSSH